MGGASIFDGVTVNGNVAATGKVQGQENLPKIDAANLATAGLGADLASLFPTGYIATATTLTETDPLDGAIGSVAIDGVAAGLGFRLLLKDEILPAIRLGPGRRLIRIRRIDLEAFVEQDFEPSTPPGNGGTLRQGRTERHQPKAS